MIYELKGRAREYSPLALNIYNGCSHKCKYCFCPAIFYTTHEKWFSHILEPKKDYLKKLEKDVNKFARSKQQVLLSFVGDPYDIADKDNRFTSETLCLFWKKNIPTAILSKGGKRILDDLGIFDSFGNHIKVGQTFTFYTDSISSEWESGASLPSERIEVAKTLHKAGIKTFASFEPVINPDESLKMMKAVMPWITEFRVGKLNNFQGLDKKIDWKAFLIEVVDLLRKHNKQIYIKKDLAAYYLEYLTDDEKNPDKWQAVPWE